MYNLNKKQKIVLAILAIIITIAICYYVYAKSFSCRREFAKTKRKN